MLTRLKNGARSGLRATCKGAETCRQRWTDVMLNYNQEFDTHKLQTLHQDCECYRSDVSMEAVCYSHGNKTLSPFEVATADVASEP